MKFVFCNFRIQNFLSISLGWEYSGRGYSILITMRNLYPIKVKGEKPRKTKAKDCAPKFNAIHKCA